MRVSTAVIATLLSLRALAQWEVPVPIQLDGAAPADRQVLGLADPISLDAGVSVEAARSTVVSFAPVSGDSILTGALSPVPSTYATGMLVTIVPDQPNTAGAELNLNGLGQRPIVKPGGVPLEAGDLAVGVPCRLIYDGLRFRLITSVVLPCPTGFHVGSRDYCIEDSSRSDTGFFPANRICRDQGARLCTFSEWTHACRKDPSFMTTVFDAEWIDSAANNVNDVKTVGYGGTGATGSTPMFGCDRGFWEISGASNRYRCCTNR